MGSVHCRYCRLKREWMVMIIESWMRTCKRQSAEKAHAVHDDAFN